MWGCSATSEATGWGRRCTTCSTPTSPQAVLAIGGTLADVPIAHSLALIWFAHIGMDRALGFGLKYPTAFRHTHLGRIGGGG
jgi:hypothetical protein